MVRQVLSSPGVLTAYLGDEVLPPVRVTEQVIAAGPRRVSGAAKSARTNPPGRSA
jgi:hypothetical protein